MVASLCSVASWVSSVVLVEREPMFAQVVLTPGL